MKQPLATYMYYNVLGFIGHMFSPWELTAKHLEAIGMLFCQIFFILDSTHENTLFNYIYCVG